MALSISTEKAKSVVEDFYKSWQDFSTTPSDADLSNVVSFFTTDCIVNLRSMRDKKVAGHEALRDDLRASLKNWQFEKRRVLASSVASDDRGEVVVSEMSNRINVLGTVLDPIHETSVIRVNHEGLIYEMKNFCCRSPVVLVTQFNTGKGPYSAEEMATAPKQMERMDTVGCCS